jgi:hypothetical protein
MRPPSLPSLLLAFAEFAAFVVLAGIAFAVWRIL